MVTTRATTASSTPETAVRTIDEREGAPHFGLTRPSADGSTPIDPRVNWCGPAPPFADSEEWEVMILPFS